MGKHGWLHEQLPGWVHDGLISESQAETLRQRYPLPVARLSRLIFAALGAVILGLGVILLFAYNWQSMHRFSKVAVILLAILSSHLSAIVVGRRPENEGRVGESLHLLGTMLFGAGIWLIAQIYHMDAHYPNAFLIWSLAALLMAWVLPSVFHGVLAAGLILLWHYSEVIDFHRANHLAPWIVAAGLIPLAWMQGSKALLLTSVITFVCSYVLVALRIDSELALTSLWLLAGSLAGAGRWMQYRDPIDASAALQGLGRAGILLFMYAGSFRDVAHRLHHDIGDNTLEWLYFAIPVAILISTWTGYFLSTAGRQVSLILRAEEALILLVMSLLIMSFGGLHTGPINWLSFNLGILAYGGVLIHQGTRDRRGGEVALGCMMICLLVFFRFTDLFNSLLMRGLLFVLLGGGVLAITLAYSRYRPVEARHA